jgi:hypothetical protein
MEKGKEINSDSATNTKREINLHDRTGTAAGTNREITTRQTEENCIPHISNPARYESKPSLPKYTANRTNTENNNASDRNRLTLASPNKPDTVTSASRQPLTQYVLALEASLTPDGDP